MDSCLTLGDEMSKQMHVLTKQKISLRQASGQSTAGTVLPYLRVYGDGVSFPGCLWPVTLLVCCIWSFLVAHTSAAKMGSTVSVSGRLAGHIMGWCLLSPFWPLPSFPS